VDVSSLLGESNSVRTPGRSTPTGGSETIVLVPFELPDNKDTALEFATTEFVKKMQTKGKTLVQTPVMDHVEAATEVATFCAQYGASSVLIGTARHEQRLNMLLVCIRQEVNECIGSVVHRPGAVLI
jgi:hypothetical protein